MTNAEILTVVFTAVIAVTGVIGAIIFNNQLSVMRGQLGIMRVEQRPWISLKVEADGPLTHDAGGWNFLIKYSLTNVGKSPAAEVDFLATMIPWGPPQPKNDNTPKMFPDARVDVRAATESICEAMTSFRAAGDSGEIMFPGEHHAKGFRARPNIPIPDAGFVRDFIVIGCATYRFIGDPAMHRTVRIIDVSKQAYGQLIDLKGETIPLEGLSPVPHSGGNFAD